MPNVRQIRNKAKALKAHLATQPIVENFGDAEQRELEDFGGYWCHDCMTRLQVRRIYDDFANWRMNFTG